MCRGISLCFDDLRFLTVRSPALRLLFSINHETRDIGSYLFLVKLGGGEIHDWHLLHRHDDPVIVVEPGVHSPERSIAYLV